MIRHLMILLTPAAFFPSAATTTRLSAHQRASTTFLSVAGVEGITAEM